MHTTVIDDPDIDEDYQCSETSSESSDESSFEDKDDNDADTPQVANTNVVCSSEDVQKNCEANSQKETVTKAKYLSLKERLINVTVPVGSNNKKWSKPDYCYYCERKFTSKISRHIRNMHATEKWVVSLLTRSKGEDETSYYTRRDIELKRIQNIGNYKHNIKVIEEGYGELAIARRPEKSVSAHNYLPCLHCYGFYLKKTLTRHIRECKLRPSHSSTGCKKDGLLLLAPFLNRPEQENMDILLSDMKETRKNEGVTDIVRNDKLIKTFGRHQLERYGDVEVRYADLNNIRSKLRSIAKLCISLKDDLPHKKDMSAMIEPSCYENFVQAVRKIANSSKQLAFALGIYIKQLTLLKIAEAIKESNRKEKENGEEFLQVYSATWTSRVSSAIAKQQRLATLRRTPELPLEDDLVTLNKFIDDEIEKADNTMRLKKLVLSSLLLFNKRRPMEVHDMTVADFLRSKRNMNDPHDKAIVSRLTATEKAIASRMTVVEVRGKSTRQIRKVYVLLTRPIVQAIEKIIMRHPNDTYIFSRPNAERPISGTEALKEVKTWCQHLKMPERIHAQKLRHYLATTCQMLKMNPGELNILADHMGHNLGVHTTRYQLQTSIIERSKVAKLLIQVEQGNEQYGLSPCDEEETTGECDEAVPGTHEIAETCDSDGKEAEEVSEDKPHVDDTDGQVMASTSNVLVVTKRKVAKKPRWSNKEKAIFDSIWQDRTTVPSSETLKRIQDALPHRSLAVLRARAHNVKKR